MQQHSNVLSFTARGKGEAPRVRSENAVRECRSVIDRALPEMVTALFGAVDDRFYGLAEVSENAELRASYYDTIRLMGQHRGEVQQYFITGVLGDFDRLWTYGPQNLSSKSSTPDSTTEAGLSLMDDEELEHSLAVNNIISKCENRFHGELYALTSRLAHLGGDIELGIRSNPLGPAAICNRFQSAFSNLSLTTPVLLVVYKLFDKQLMSHLGGLYEKLNTLLARYGILPKLESQPARASSQPDAKLAGDDHYSDDAGVQEDLFPTLQALLAAYRPENQGARPAIEAEQRPPVATHELLGALSLLQHVNLEFPASDIGVQQIADLRRHLSDQLNLEANSGLAGRTLGKTDGDALDVVAMLFEFTLEDPYLPDAMKALIARLQIPIAKVAILDKTFFSHKRHPARRLLNNLAWAAVGWSDDGNRSENSLYGRIESVVNRVVAGFQEDLSVFKELNEEFSAYIEHERKTAKIFEERTNQAVRGKEKLQVAKQTVEAEIEQRLGGHARVPPAARTLLENGWKDLLVLTYLRQGPESKAWTDKLDVADHLLWSLRPKMENHQRRDLLRMIPDLQRSLREGLESISYDQQKIERSLEALRACHIACLRGVEGPDTGAVHPGQSLAPPVGKETARPSAPDRASRTPAAAAGEGGRQDKYVKIAENLPRGAWLELREKSGKQSRIKLSWKSDIYDHYLFVNRRGVKVMDTTMEGVAKLFRNGDVSILEHADAPFTDRALDTMVETLKRAGGGA